MFDQTPLNRLNGMNWHREGNGHRSDQDVSGVRRLLADISELAELQMRLMADDAKCQAESLVKPAILAAVGLIIVFGTLPVVLLAIANVLIEQLSWSPALALAVVAGSSLLVAVGLGALSLHKLKACDSPLRRSLVELDKNMDTMRAMLLGKDLVREHLERRERRDGN